MDDFNNKMEKLGNIIGTVIAIFLVGVYAILFLMSLMGLNQILNNMTSIH